MIVYTRSFRRMWLALLCLPGCVRAAQTDAVRVTAETRINGHAIEVVGSSVGARDDLHVASPPKSVIGELARSTILEKRDTELRLTGARFNTAPLTPSGVE